MHLHVFLIMHKPSSRDLRKVLTQTSAVVIHRRRTAKLNTVPRRRQGTPRHSSSFFSATFVNQRGRHELRPGMERRRKAASFSDVGPPYFGRLNATRLTERKYEHMFVSNDLP